jgi:UDPglucose 6-dehydrogenase
MRLVVVGTGYVGLVTGVCFAELGHQVVCVENDDRKLTLLRRGSMPIYEPGLEELALRACAARQLAFQGSLRHAARDADAVFIAVGTPTRETDGSADLSHVFSVAQEMAPALRNDAVVVVKSTVPVGTGDAVERTIRRHKSGVTVVSNPEFLRAGSAIRDFMQPDRIIVGADDYRAREVMRRIYEPLRRRTGAPLVFAARRSSELIKYGANALLATKIAFINEMADLCERSAADVREVAHGIGLDRRIGPRFLRAGPGFGGSCFRKDALALVRMGEEHGVPMQIAEAVIFANDERKRTLVRRVAAAIGGSLRGKMIGVWGLTFKPNTDDVRESPSLPLVSALLEAGAIVQIYDPEGMAAAKTLWPGRVKLASDANAAAHDASALVIMTEWEEFRSADLGKLRTAMVRPIIVDMRSLYSADDMRKLGFSYYSVGRSATLPAGSLAANGKTGADRRGAIAAVPASQPQRARLRPVALS